MENDAEKSIKHISTAALSANHSFAALSLQSENSGGDSGNGGKNVERDEKKVAKYHHLSRPNTAH